MKTTERGSATETKRALFRAAQAAQDAGEATVKVNRIVAALLRANSVGAYCDRVHIDGARVSESFEDGESITLDQAELRAKEELGRDGLEIGSSEHLARLDQRPFDAVSLVVIGAIIERHGHIGVTPLELLLDLMLAEPALATRLAREGFDADAIRAALDER